MTLRCRHFRPHKGGIIRLPRSRRSVCPVSPEKALRDGLALPDGRACKPQRGICDKMQGAECNDRGYFQEIFKEVFR